MAKNEDKKPEVEIERDPNEGLVKMIKGEEVLHVHPDTVKAHTAVGWRAH